MKKDGISGLKGISLFCGAGGLDMGFERAGFKTVWCNDMFLSALQTHAGWNSAFCVNEDIRKIKNENIPDADFVLSGFPCPGYSIAGPRRLDDKRNTLYLETVRVIQDKKPLFFVCENVKGILSMGGGAVIKTIVDDFAACGYNVFYELLNAADYGVPQDRERVIIVGFRKDLGICDSEDYRFPEKRPDKVTLRDAIGGHPAPKDGDVCFEGFTSRYMSRNRKRGWDDVSFTIPAQAKQVPLWPGSADMVKLGTDMWEFGGPSRRLSWQECASIQTFPEGMFFEGNLTDVYKQIGNAVPVVFAEAVADSVRDALLSEV